MVMSREFKNAVWEITEMMRIFKDELEAKERCTMPSSNNDDDPSDDGYSTLNLHTQQRRGKGGQNRGAPKKRSCGFCGKEDHSASQCSNVTDLNARVAAMKKANRCFVCFGQGHVSRNCKSQNQCNHHISICGYFGQSEEQQLPEQGFQGNEQQGFQGDASQGNQFQGQLPGHGAAQNVPQNPYFQQNFPPRAPTPFNPNAGGFRPNGSGGSAPQTRPPNTVTSVTSCNVNAEEDVLLLTGRTTICHPDDRNQSCGVRMLFDDCSQRTYVTNAVRETLQLPTIRTDRISVKVFGGHESSLKEVDIVQIRVIMRNGSSVYIEAASVSVVCSPLPDQQTKSAKLSYEHLRNLNISDYSDDKEKGIDILVGGDYYWSIITGKVIRGPNNSSPVALESGIGWILSGRYATLNRNHEVSTMLTITQNDSTEFNVDNSVKEFFARESVHDPASEKVLENFERDIEFSGEKYVVKLPLKEDHEILPDNYQLCMKRFLSNEKRLEKHEIEDLPEQYNQVFEDYKAREMIERVDPEDVGIPGRVHYLPHRAVVKPERETTKIRPVFDASAKIRGGSSLNDILDPGINLLELISEMIIRFRFHKIVLLSDIKQAFLNVKVHRDHIDMLRFLLREDGVIATYRFLVVVFGLTPSPFLLLATIRFHCRKMVKEGHVDQEFVRKFLKSLYMDDVINGGDTVAEGFELYKKSKWLMQTAGFELRKWCSNNKELMALINKAESGVASDEPDPVSDNSQGMLQKMSLSVLGHFWNVDTDEINYEFSKIISSAKEITLTKQNVLKVGATFYDAIGIIAPVVTQFKIIFQLLCVKKIGWSTIIPDEVAIMWQRFIVCLEGIGTIKIPRCILPESCDDLLSVQIHGFSDSSELAYCAVVYLRRETLSGVRVQILTAKTKVAPLIKQTVPRLELLSCLHLSNLLSSMTGILSDRFENTPILTCWNDNSSALGWIRGEHKKWSLWIENRVKKVRKVVKSSLWRHVPGNINPADVATRRRQCGFGLDQRRKMFVRERGIMAKHAC